MKVIFVAGGTAGHVNPALAVASSMPKDTEILFPSPYLIAFSKSISG